MSTILNAQIDTSFKGEDLSLKATLDLNKLGYDPEIPIQVFHYVATQNNIDQYSYLYEILEVEPVQYSSDNATVAQFISEDGHYFDWEGYEQARKYQLAEAATERLLNHYFSQQEQADNENLKKALRDAFILGSEQ